MLPSTNTSKKRIKIKSVDVCKRGHVNKRNKYGSCTECVRVLQRIRRKHKPHKNSKNSIIRGRHKKNSQLGMSFSVATVKLLRHIVFSNSNKECYRCGKSLDINDFSLDHKVSWLDSSHPIDLFFDVTNVALSHRECNSRASRLKHITKEDFAKYKEETI